MILAQQGSDGAAAESGSSEGSVSIFDQLIILFRPEELLDQLSRIPLILAAVVVTLGILSIFNGYRWHKWLVAVLAFVIGLGLGWHFSQQMGRSVVVAAAVGGLFAIVATPLLRITVALFGGITGAFIGANAWLGFEIQPTDGHWAGAVIGFIVVAMLSVVLFKLVVVMFTSVGGAVMAVCGTITLLMYVPEWEPAVRNSLTQHQLLVPLLLAVAATSGFVVQEARLRNGGVKIFSTKDGEK
jgi:hypothetical protein